MFECDHCGKVFTRADNRNRHMNNSCKGKRIKLDTECGPSNCIKCDVCDVFVEKQYYNSHIRTNSHRTNAFVVVDDGVEKNVGAFGDRIVSYRISNSSQNYIDVEEFTADIREKVLTLIDSILVVHNSVKVNAELFGLYYLSNKEDVEIKSFNTRNKIITHGSNLYEIYSKYVDEMTTKMSEFQERDSGISKRMISLVIVR